MVQRHRSESGEPVRIVGDQGRDGAVEVCRPFSGRREVAEIADQRRNGGKDLAIDSGGVHVVDPALRQPRRRGDATYDLPIASQPPLLPLGDEAGPTLIPETASEVRKIDDDM